MPGSTVSGSPILGDASPHRRVPDCLKNIFSSGARQIRRRRGLKKEMAELAPRTGTGFGRVISRTSRGSTRSLVPLSGRSLSELWPRVARAMACSPKTDPPRQWTRTALTIRAGSRRTLLQPSCCPKKRIYVLFISLFQPHAATDRLLAKLRRDLVGHSVQFPLTLTVGLIVKLLLGRARVIQLGDTESQQPHR